MTDKLDLKSALEELKAANERLENAILATITVWPPYDLIGEPTDLLEKHKIKNGNGNGYYDK
jgi:hypothetical protein